MIALVALLQQSAPVTFVDFTKDKDPSLAWLILGTFSLIALILTIAVGVGAGVGMLRIWVMRRFPGNRFNGMDDEPTIRLHLNEGLSPKSSPSRGEGNF